MTAVKDHTGGDHHLYVRNFDNDLPSSAPARRTWAGQAARVAKVALPYLSLYQPISKPLTLAMGAVRSLQSAHSLVTAIQSGERLAILRAVVELAVAVASVAGTVFAHPLGMLISTTHDLVLAIAGLVQAIRSGDREAILQASLQVASSALYLALMGFGGMHLMIASTALQIAIGAVQSRHEWARGNYLEALGQLGMVGIRGKQLVGQAQAALMMRRIRLETEERARTEKAIAPLKELLAEQQEMIQKLKEDLAAAKEKANELERRGSAQTDLIEKQSELGQAMAKHANNSAGCTALQHAVLMQDHKAVDLFLEAGANPASISTSRFPDCLVLATAVQDCQLVKKFLEIQGFDQRCRQATEQCRIHLDSHPWDHRGSDFSAGLSAFSMAIATGNQDVIGIFLTEFSKFKIPEARPRELELVLFYFFYDALLACARFGRDSVLEELLRYPEWLSIIQRPRLPNNPFGNSENHRTEIKYQLYDVVTVTGTDRNEPRNHWSRGLQTDSGRLPSIGAIQNGWWSICEEGTSPKGRAYCKVLLEQQRMIEQRPQPSRRYIVQ
jgi:hypothetical protein